MTRLSLPLWIALTSSLAIGQSLEEAKITLPYPELKSLLQPTSPSAATPLPSRLSTHLKWTIVNEQPVIEATFRVASYSDALQQVALLNGAFAMDQVDPATTILSTQEQELRLSCQRSGVHSFKALIHPIESNQDFSLQLPSCPSIVLDVAELPKNLSYTLTSQRGLEILKSNSTHHFSHQGDTLTFHRLQSEEQQALTQAPIPSDWSWQHESLVQVKQDQLTYQIISHATATSGSGMEAQLQIPHEARNLLIAGDDLLQYKLTRTENRQQIAHLSWKSRDILDRSLVITYQMPIRPMDASWTLQSPGDSSSQSRYYLSHSPSIHYGHPKISQPFAAASLPSTLSAYHDRSDLISLDGSNREELKVERIPVAVTSNSTIQQAIWSVKIEPDGAMLLTGEWKVTHHGAYECLIDTPQGLSLLTANIDQTPTAPIDLGKGQLKFSGRSTENQTTITCEFTGKLEAFNPIEGTLSLDLPKTPTFINSLDWFVQLPAGYQAQAQGNLKTLPTRSSDPPNSIHLQKNLVRDERPSIHLFYQKNNLAR